MAKKPDEAKISKAEAVRRAMAEGLESLDEGIAFIKSKFGIDMDKSMFSSYKSQEKARQQKKDGQSTHGIVAPKAKASTNGKPSMALQMEAIKTLVNDLGVEEVVSIAKLFAK